MTDVMTPKTSMSPRQPTSVAAGSGAAAAGSANRRIMERVCAIFSGKFYMPKQAPPFVSPPYSATGPTDGPMDDFPVSALSHPSSHGSSLRSSPQPPRSPNPALTVDVTGGAPLPGDNNTPTNVDASGSQPAFRRSNVGVDRSPGRSSTSSGVLDHAAIMPGSDRMGVYEFVKFLGRGAEGTAFLVKTVPVRYPATGNSANGNGSATDTSSNGLSLKSGASSLSLKGIGSLNGSASSGTGTAVNLTAPMVIRASSPGGSRTGGVDSQLQSACDINVALAEGHGAENVGAIDENGRVNDNMLQESQFRVVKIFDVPDTDPDKQRLIDRARSEIMCLDQIGEQFISILGFFGAVEGRYSESMFRTGEPGGTMIAMIIEYCDSHDLRKEIKSRIPKSMDHTANKQQAGPFSEREALLIFVQILLAVAKIHSLNMMHRDIKTANIFLMKTGLLKVGDFGFARSKYMMTDSVSGETICGTPHMMAPEVWRGKAYTQKVDIFSLGVVLYELLTLDRPFDGSSISDVEKNIMKGQIRPLPKSISTDSCDLVMSMLQQDPKKRPSAAKVINMSFIRAAIASFEINAPSLPGCSEAILRATRWARSTRVERRHASQATSPNAQQRQHIVVNGPRARLSPPGHKTEGDDITNPLHPPEDGQDLSNSSSARSESFGSFGDSIQSASIGSLCLAKQPQGTSDNLTNMIDVPPQVHGGAPTGRRELLLMKESWGKKLSVTQNKWKSRFFRLVCDTVTWRHYVLMTVTDESTTTTAGSSGAHSPTDPPSHVDGVTPLQPPPSGVTMVDQAVAAMPLSAVDDVFLVPSTFMKNSNNTLWIHSNKSPKFFVKFQNEQTASEWVDVLRKALVDADDF